MRIISRIAILALLSLSCTGCSVMSQIGIDPVGLVYSAGNAITAATLSDSEIVKLSRQTVAQMDMQNKVDVGKYHDRLQGLLTDVKDINGQPLDFKVYITNQINAFACGDGSIRVYSGLMDVMDDAQLMAIIGHEIGHVVHKDTKKAMQRAYAGAAARGLVASTNTVAGAIAGSALGDIASSFVGAQFSQKQEFAADEYGCQFAIDHGFPQDSMASALEKLVSLKSSSSTASRVAQMFSSHPDSAVRAQRLREKISL